MAEVFHISKEDAARDFDGLLHRVHGGEVIVVEDCGRAVAVMKAPDVGTISPVQVPGKTIPEILASLGEWEGVHGRLVVDHGFAQDVAEAHERFNRPLDAGQWD